MKRDRARLQMLSDKVTINLNVFRLFMEDSIVDNLNSIVVVTIGRGWRRLRYTQIREKTTKPNKFSSSMSNSTLAIDHGIIQRDTISRVDLHIKLNRCIRNLSISKTGTVNNLISILGLRQKIALWRRGNLNTKKIPQWTQILYFEGAEEILLDLRDSRRVKVSDDHIIHIE
ncbi:hypothetical protein CsSME_00025224 [Camellia sinensis var. sinensis]